MHTRPLRRSDRRGNFVEPLESRTLLAGNGLLGVYYNNADFTGTSANRVDLGVNFNFANGAPRRGIAPSTYSVRWTGQVRATRTETITFHTITNDGVRLYVNGQKLIDSWGTQSAVEHTGSIALSQGFRYNITLEYFNNTGPAVARLMWSSPTIAKQVIPASLLFYKTGSIVSTPTTPTATTGSLRVSSNGRYLETSTGKPFFYLADTAWQLPAKLTPAEVDVYLKDRAAKGFNAIQIVLVDGDYWKPNYAGRTPLINNNPATPNDRYFRDIDSVVAKAAAYGMYVSMVPTWGVNVADPARRIFNTTTAYSYGKFLGARYKNNWNVIWINGGDWKITDSTTRAIWQSLAKGLDDGDAGDHLITFHPYGKDTSRTYWPNESWMDFSMIQSGHQRDSASYDLISLDYGKTPAKPVVDGEPNYENIPGDAYRGLTTGARIDAYDVRKKAYWDIFAGGAGVAYGAVEIYQFYVPGGEADNAPQRPWQQALGYAGAGQMQYLKKLMESRAYFTRVPDQSVIVSTNYTGTNHIQATRDSGGAFVMVYSAGGKAFTVNMAKITGGTAVSANWYDPRTGKWTSIGRFAHTGTRTFTPPTSGYGQDWVLVLDRV